MLDIPSKLRREFKVKKSIFVRKETRLKQRVSYAQRTYSALRKLILKRHDGCPVFTDDGQAYLDVILPLLLRISRERGKGVAWVLKEAEELLPLLDWSDEDWWAEEVRLAGMPKGMKPDEIATKLQIHEAELDTYFETKRQRCGVVSVERPKKVRKAQMKAYQAAYHRTYRKKSQKTPRAVYEANSISRTKPWLAAGFKARRTWERHGKPLPSPDVVSTVINPSLDVGKFTQPTTPRPSISIAAEPANNRQGRVQAWQSELAIASSEKDVRLRPASPFGSPSLIGQLQRRPPALGR